MLDAAPAPRYKVKDLVPYPKGNRHVDPNGWDIVSAVRISALNAAIRNAGTTPDGFEHEPVEGARVSAKFDPWEIAPDGDGLLINLTVNLRDIEVEYRGQSASLPAGKALVRVELEYMPAEPVKMKGLLGAPVDEEQEVNPFLLVMRTKANPHGPLMMMAGEEKVAQVLGFNERRELGRLYSAFKVGLEQWLNDNLASFQHVFASVNVIGSVAKDTEGGFDWIKPSAISYAFGHDYKNPEESVLAILCRTGGRNADGLIAQAQADMIPPGSNASICISRQRIAQDMVAPGLAEGFDGLTAKDLHLSGKGSVVNVTKAVNLEQVEDPDSGKVFDPVLKSLKVSVTETGIEVRSNTETEITKGVWSILNTISNFTLGMPKGKKGLAFAEVSTDTKHQQREDTTATILEWVAKAFAIIGLAALTVLSGGTLLVVGAITAALLFGTVRRDYIKLANGEDGPPIDLLIANATQTVSWSTAETFDPQIAGMNGGLVIGGKVPVQEAKMLLGAPMDNAQKSFQAPFAAAMAARAKAGS